MEFDREFVTLHSGDKMPIMGYGTSQQADKDAIVDAVVNAGFRHIDTARMYGNEDLIGDAIVECIEKGVPRSELFIVTKVFNPDYHDVVTACKESLEKLKCEYIDMYLVHWGYNQIDETGKKFRRIPMYKIWAQMEEWVELGLVKNIGLSNFHCQLLLDMFTYCNIMPSWNQIELHPYLQQPELLKFMKENNIAAVAYSPLSAPGRNIIGRFEKTIFDDEVITKIAENNNVTNAQVALAWNMQRGVTVIPKCSSLKRAQENFESCKITLSEDEMEEISALDLNQRIFDPINFDFALHVPYFK